MVWRLASLLHRVAARLDSWGYTLTDERCAYMKTSLDDPAWRRVCDEYPGTGRHYPASQCPLIHAGRECLHPEEHHQWQPRHWWLHFNSGQQILEELP